MSTRPGEIKIVPADGNDAATTAVFFDGTRDDFLEANYAAEQVLRQTGGRIVLPGDLRAEDLIEDPFEER